MGKWWGTFQRRHNGVFAVVRISEGAKLLRVDDRRVRHLSAVLQAVPVGGSSSSRVLRRRRELLTELARAAAEAVSELVRSGLGADARPGIVVSIATAGDLLQWHPHLHLLTTDCGPNARGHVAIHAAVGQRSADDVVWRAAARPACSKAGEISQELVTRLLAWRHPGFSAHVGEPIMASDRQRLEDTAAYLVRNPLSLKKLVYLDGQQAVLYRSRMNPSLGP